MDNANVYTKLYEYFQKNEFENASSDLHWLFQRCKIEFPSDDDSVNDYSHTKGILGGFLVGFLHINDPTAPDFNKIFENKEPTYSFQDDPEYLKKFSDFLSNQTREENYPDKYWTNNPKKLIDKIKMYRHATNPKRAKNDMNNAASINKDDPTHFIFELIQNADDCEYENFHKNVRNSINADNCKDKNDDNLVSVKVKIINEGIEISYPEDGMKYDDILAISTIGESNKVTVEKKKKQIIGEKGRGFKSVFNVFDLVAVYSKTYRFILSQENFEPVWIPANLEMEQYTEKQKWILKEPGEIGEHFENYKNDGFIPGTVMLMNFKPDTVISKDEIFSGLLKKFGIENGEIKAEDIFLNCPILFTQNITELTIENGEKTYTIKRYEKNGHLFLEYLGKNTDLKIEYLKAETSVKFEFEEYISRYPELFEKNEESKKKYEEYQYDYKVVMLAPIDKDEITTGKLFSYLPTATEISVPLVLQIPYKLNQNRERMWLKPQDAPNEENCDPTQWNERLFNEVFKESGLLEIMFERIKEQYPEDPEKVFKYVPKEFFFDPDEYCRQGDNTKIQNRYKELEIFNDLLDNKCLSAEKARFFNKEANDIIFSSDNKNGLIKEIHSILYGENTKAETVKYIVNEGFSDGLVKYLGLQEIKVKNTVDRLKIATLLATYNHDGVIKALKGSDTNADPRIMAINKFAKDSTSNNDVKKELTEFLWKVDNKFLDRIKEPESKQGVNWKTYLSFVLNSSDDKEFKSAFIKMWLS